MKFYVRFPTQSNIIHTHYNIDGEDALLYWQSNAEFQVSKHISLDNDIVN